MMHHSDESKQIEIDFVILSTPTNKIIFNQRISQTEIISYILYFFFSSSFFLCCCCCSLSVKQLLATAHCYRSAVYSIASSKAAKDVSCVRHSIRCRAHTTNYLSSTEPAGTRADCRWPPIESFWAISFLTYIFYYARRIRCHRGIHIHTYIYILVS